MGSSGARLLIMIALYLLILPQDDAQLDSVPVVPDSNVVHMLWLARLRCFFKQSAWLQSL